MEQVNRTIDIETRRMELRGMVKAPTGQSTKTIAGEQDPHIQVGTGSWDFGLGLAAGHHFESFALYASAFDCNDCPMHQTPTTVLMPGGCG